MAPETTYRIEDKQGKLLSRGLTQYMVDYLIILKKWPKDKLIITPES